MALQEDGDPVAGRKLSYSIVADGVPGTAGTAASALEPYVITLKAPDTPGWVLLTVEVLDGKGRTVTTQRAGVMVDPEEIEPGAGTPGDFDAFWAKQKQALAEVPMAPVLKPVDVDDDLKDKVVAFDVRLDCGSANTCYGYLASPAPAKGHGTGHPDAVVSLKALFGRE